MLQRQDVRGKRWRRKKDLVPLEAGMCLLCLGAFPIAPKTGQHEVGGRAKPSDSSSKVYV